MYLVIGGNSEIGSATAALLQSRGADVAVTTRRLGPSQKGIFLDFDRIEDGWVPEGVEAACVFVAVARLAACEADPVGSARINVEQTLKLVRTLTQAGVYTLFLSTNQVFDGTQPRVAADAPFSPQSAYGRQKADTETALQQMQARGKPVGVLRLAKIVSSGMALLANWRTDLAAGRRVRAFSDMVMAPTPTTLVAEAIAGLLAERQAGVAQLTGPRDISYFEAARLIARHVGADPGLVEAASALDHGVPPGGTPRNTTLDSQPLEERYGIKVPPPESVVLAALPGVDASDTRSQ